MWLQQQVAFVILILAPVLLVVVPLTVAYVKDRKAKRVRGEVDTPRSDSPGAGRA